jgi:hypothetical protein
LHITEIGKRVDVFETKNLNTERTIQNLKATTDLMSNRERDLSEDVARYQDEVFSIKKKMDYLEAYSRRENLIFTGIPEIQDEDTEQVWRSFLSRELSMHGEFQRIHRLGKKRTTTRPIIARFLRYSDREKVAGNAFRLKGTNKFVFPDFPKEIQESRKRQLHKLKKAKQEGKSVSFSKSKPDMLYINGQYIREY